MLLIQKIKQPVLSQCTLKLRTKLHGFSIVFRTEYIIRQYDLPLMKIAGWSDDFSLLTHNVLLTVIPNSGEKYTVTNNKK